MIPKIYECLADDALRPAMSYALVTREKTAASDAHILVVHSTKELFGPEFVKSIPEEGFMFTRELLVDLAKLSAQQIEYLEETKQIKVTHFPKGKEPANRYFDIKKQNMFTGKYPDFEKVLPKDKLKPLESICFNPAILVRLTKAMTIGGDKVRLKFRSPPHAIVCEALSNQEYPSCIGIIIPVMSD